MNGQLKAIAAFHPQCVTGGPGPVTDRFLLAATRPFLDRRTSEAQAEQDRWQDYWYLQLLPWQNELTPDER